MKSILTILIVLLITSGCASITRGTSESYAIETIPPGAAVKLSTGLNCETPCSVKVKRRSDFTVTIEKEGYETVRATVTSSVDGAGAAGMAGNVILGGIIGAGVDAGTGAMHSHKPNPLSVTMTKLTDLTANTGPRELIFDESGSEIDPLSIEVGVESEDEHTQDETEDTDPLALTKE